LEYQQRHVDGGCRGANAEPGEYDEARQQGSPISTGALRFSHGHPLAIDCCSFLRVDLKRLENITKEQLRSMKNQELGKQFENLKFNLIEVESMRCY